VNLLGLILLYSHLLLERMRLERLRTEAMALRLTRGRRG